MMYTQRGGGNTKHDDSPDELHDWVTVSDKGKEGVNISQNFAELIHGWSLS